MSFVKVQNAQFIRNGRRLTGFGGNKYQLQVSTQSESDIRSLLQAARDIKIPVLRTWAFDAGNPPTDSDGNFRYLEYVIGTNVLSNGSFESGSSPWTLGSDWSRVNTDSHDGSWSIKQVSTTAYSSAYILATVTPSTNYILTFWYKVSNTSGNPPVLFIGTSPGNNNIKDCGYNYDTGGVWKRKQITFNSGANSSLYITFQNFNGVVTSFIDDVTLSVQGGAQLAYREQTFAHFDLLMALAEEYEVMIQPVYADNPFYDTKKTYVTWANSIYNAGLSTAYPYVGFWTDPYCKLLYKQFFYTLMNRVNTVNGRIYKNNPWIFAHEMGNELRYDVFDSEGGTQNTTNSTNIAKVKAWMEEMGAYMKMTDPNHLVTYGNAAHTWQWVQGDTVSNGSGYGVDYNKWAASPYIDFLQFHTYPTQGGGDIELKKFGQRLGYPDTITGDGYRAQLRDFVDVAKANGKPAVIGEVGFSRPVVRSNTYFPLYPRKDAFEEIARVWFEEGGDLIYPWNFETNDDDVISYSINITGTWNGNTTNLNFDDRPLVDLMHIRNLIGVESSLLDELGNPLLDEGEEYLLEEGGISHEFTIDGIVLATTPKTFTADGVVLVVTTKTFTADGIVTAITPTIKTFTVDGIVKVTTTQTVTVDGVVQILTTATFTVDGIVKVITTQTFTVDAIVKVVVTASVGTLINLDGVDDRIAVSNPGINIREFSISWWTEVFTQDSSFADQWNDWWSIVGASGGHYVAEIKGLFTAQTGAIFTTKLSGFTGAGGVDTSTDIRNTGLHHFVVTASATNNEVKLYKDSVLIGSGTWSPASEVISTLTIGSRTGDTGRAIKATIGSFRVFGAPLNQNQINTLYNNDASNAPMEVEYLFISKSATVATDSSGNARNGTISGTPSFIDGFRSFTADGIVKTVVDNTFTADGIVKQIATKTFTADGLVLVGTTNTFTVDGIIVEIKTFTFTVDGYIVVAVGRPTITADGLVYLESNCRNLVGDQNIASFEKPEGGDQQTPQGWTNFNSAGVPTYKGTSFEEAVDGHQSFKISASSNVDTGLKRTFTFQPGTQVTASIHVKTDASVVNAVIVWNDLNTGAGSGNVTSAGANKNQRISVTRTVPSNGQLTLFIGLGAFGSQSQGTVHFDALMINIGATAFDYCPASTEFTVDGIISTVSSRVSFTVDAIIAAIGQFGLLFGYVLNGVRLKGAKNLKRIPIYQKTEYVSITGKTTRDVGGFKEKYILRMEFLTKDEVDILQSICNLGTPVLFTVNLKDQVFISTNVFPYIDNMVYDVLGSDYLASLNLELTEVE